jgi:hypothetical protein
VKRPLLAATTLALIFVHPCGVNAQAVQTWQYANINTTATTTLKTTPGVLHEICVNTPNATGTVQIYDSTAASGNKIGLITQYASTPRCFTYDVAFWTGLTIVTATAAGDLAVSFR